MARAVVLIICGGGRFAIRAIYGSQLWRFKSNSDAHLPRTLIVGAGETGSLSIKRMLNGDPDMIGDPVAVVDDDPNKQNQRIHDVKVYGTCADIPTIAHDCEAEQIVVAIPSATHEERQRIYDLCMNTGLRVLTLPNVRDIPQDGVGRVALREVEISDLLSREEKSLDLNQMGYVTGKRILVTGGGGSIGSELVRQLLPAKPAQIVLFDIYENTTYELYHDIIKTAHDQGTDIQVYIGSITHLPAITKSLRSTIRKLFSTLQPTSTFLLWNTTPARQSRITFLARSTSCALPTSTSAVTMCRFLPIRPLIPLT